MKKRHSIHLLLAAAALLLATAACTQDELADGDRLPEGQYPVEIARITLGVEGGEAQPWGAPQTRVGEAVDGTGSVFSAGDRFAVQINGEEGIYIVQDDGTATSDAPLYWTNTIPNRTVTAWYPATGGTLDLSDQSQSLAYLLYGTGSGNYQTPVTLTFTHQLAKVRVTPTDVALDEVTSLQLYTYTQCTYEKGEAGQGSQEGWIEMKPCEYTENGTTITCWEANVVPDYTITRLRANGTEERDLSTTFTPKAGVLYNITLDYDPGYTTTTDDQGQTIYNTDNEKGLKNLAKLVNEEGKTDIDITLTGDIALTGEWTPIGTESQPYTGTFDGGGHTLTINLPNQNYVGLIGCLGSGGTVQDLTMDKGDITGGNFVGGVVGSNFEGGTVTGCYATGAVSGGDRVGGVVGYNEFGIVTGCSSSATVEGGDCVGGVVGYNEGGTVTGCYATGSVSDTGGSYVYVGGVVGYNHNGTVTGCYHATGKVSGTGDYVGGVVGLNNNSTVTGCYWSDYDGNGIGDGSGETTKVNGTDVTWENAQSGMNIAIDAWNDGNPYYSCNWQFANATATTPPTLVASSNP